MEWYPEKPTLAQVTVGIVFLVALAVLSLSWSANETEVGNRIILRVLAGLFLLLATWRTCIAIRLVRDRRPKH